MVSLWEEAAKRSIFIRAFSLFLLLSTSLFGFFSGERTTPTTCKVTFLKMELKDFYGNYHEIYSGSSEVDIASTDAWLDVSHVGDGHGDAGGPPHLLRPPSNASGGT